MSSLHNQWVRARARMLPGGACGKVAEAASDDGGGGDVNSTSSLGALVLDAEVGPWAWVWV